MQRSETILKLAATIMLAVFGAFLTLGLGATPAHSEVPRNILMFSGTLGMHVDHYSNGQCQFVLTLTHANGSVDQIKAPSAPCPKF